jgi:magnesium-transporting ATPase (P-type)
MSVTCFKDAYEDYQRHKSDNKVNTSKARVLTPEGETQVLWKDVKVGDLLLVKNYEPFPADMVVVGTGSADGICYIETSNIDGETNLKIRERVAGVDTSQPLNGMAGTLVGRLDWEAPNKSIYTFTGSLEMDKGPLPLDAKNLLLRGSVLRNTPWVHGVVVYTGPESKIMMNSRATPSKLSKIEHTVNRMLYMILLCQAVLSLISVICLELQKAGMWNPYGTSTAGTGGWYLADPNSQTFDLSSPVANFLTFVILYNNFVPISLYVTMEMINVLQASLINSDLGMYDEGSDTPALTRTSNLCQELGQIEYIFSDKTGTLTQNVMELKRALIGTEVYGTSVGDKRLLFEDERMVSHVWGGKADATQKSRIEQFFTLLAVCHTVVVEKKQQSETRSSNASNIDEEEEEIDYQAESPDDQALVKAAAAVGFSLNERTTDVVSLRVGMQKSRAKPKNYEVLAINQFSSARKRMSSLVRINGQLVLMAKGADNVILDRAVGGADSPQYATLLSQLSDFAKEGLRTLVIAQRQIPEVEATAWLKKYHAAAAAIENRGEKLEEVAEEIEKQLTVVGATAIEDKLQDGVPNAIAELARAGIKLWVLTGDKQETAINIGYSCKLLTQKMSLLRVGGAGMTEGAIDAQLDQLDQFIGMIKDGTAEGATGDAIDKLAVACGANGDEEDASGASGTGPVLLSIPRGDVSQGSLTSGQGGGSFEANPIATVRHGRDSSKSDLGPRSPPQSPEPASKGGGEQPPTAAERRQMARRVTSNLIAGDLHLHGMINDGKVRTDARGVSETSSVATPLNPTRTPVQPMSSRSSLLQQTSTTSRKGETGSQIRRTWRIEELAVVLDGPSLLHVLGRDEAKAKLLAITNSCTAVIACRVSPSQKALIVKMVKEGIAPTPMTLAIGDGANDVGMIQEAHLGIGISGKEGLQAVNSADFAIAQFRFLKSLLVVHGRWNYRRMAKVVRYSFYKNIVLTLTLFYFNYFSGFSGQSLYETNIYSLYNFALGLPPVAMGLFDTDLTRRFVSAHPEMYRTGRMNLDLNNYVMARWIFKVLAPLQ